MERDAAFEMSNESYRDKGDVLQFEHLMGRGGLSRKSL